MTQLPRIQDNLYMAVNGAWQEETVIPPDKSMVSADSNLSDDIRAKLVRDLTDLAAGTKQTTIASLQYAAKLYVKAADKAARAKVGIAPVLPRLQRLEALRTLEAFRDALPDLLQQGYALPVDMWVGADMHDPQINQLQLAGFDTILPDAAQYATPSKANDEKFAAWSAMAKDLLLAAGYDATTADQYVADALAFDQRNAALMPSNEWLAIDKNWDNAVSWSELATDTQGIGLTTALMSMVPAAPANVNLITPKVVAGMGTLIDEANYHEWQHMAIIRELIDDSGLFSDELRVKGDAYDRLLSGREVAVDWVKAAFNLTTRYLSDPIGLYYGQTYFGEAAKQDITAMVKQIIAQYEVQLRHNTWLSDATREKAIAKLKTMKIKMGYPDDVFALFKTLHFDDDDDLFTAVSKLADQTLAFRLAQVGQSVDRSEWEMPGYLVNACYEPTMNDITFPAGILQPPYYSLDWSQAAKLGGTGATIGHEISHSFDNNGAEYDATGKMSNWWTDADKAAFAKDVDAVADQFDGRDSYGTKINGRLTVSENIADNAGMAVALDILGKDASEQDLQDFFVAYTKSWATKMRPELAQNLAETDVHAPAELRVNVPVLNFDAWYRAYGVQAGDGMYLAPEKRVNIWNK